MVRYKYFLYFLYQQHRLRQIHGPVRTVCGLHTYLLYYDAGTAYVQRFQSLSFIRKIWQAVTSQKTGLSFNNVTTLVHSTDRAGPFWPIFLYVS
jgi:hypothetical protein